LLSSEPEEVSPSVGSTDLLVPGGMLSQQAMNAESQQQGGENTVSDSWMSLQNCCGIVKNRERRHRGFSGSNIY
jgi:hypothetical protein